MLLEVVLLALTPDISFKDWLKFGLSFSQIRSVFFKEFNDKKEEKMDVKKSLYFTKL